MWYVTVIIRGVKYWVFTQPHATMSATTIFLGPSAEWAEAYAPSELMRIVWAVEQMFPETGKVETIECSSRKLIPENLQWFLCAAE